MQGAEQRGPLRHVAGIARFVAETLVLPLGVGLAVGAALAAMLEPRWRTGGLVYLLQYPNNVEVAATLGGLLAAGAAGMLCRFRLARWVLGGVAAAGWVIAAVQVTLVSRWLAPLVVVGLTLAALGACEARRAGARLEVATRPGRRAWRRLLLAAVLSLACGLAFAKGLTPAAPIDVFHHGEILTSAVDLLEGGRPFDSFVWPHGLHNSGLTAIWIELTGKVGLSSVSLARASYAALAPLTVFLLALSVLPVSVAAVLALALALVMPFEGSALAQLGRLPFAAAALALVASRHPNGGRYLIAGLAVGLQHLFRIDGGLFMLIAIGAGAAWRGSIEARGAAARILAAMRSGALVAIGFVLAMLGSWAILGWPNRAWWTWMLQLFPTYHLDAIGLPMPWPVDWSQAALPILERFTVTAATALVLTALFMAVAARRASGRGTLDPRLTSWLLVVAVFGWQAARSLLGRSDAHVTAWTPFLAAAVLCLVVRGAWEAGGRTAAVAALVAGSLFLDLRFLTPVGPQALAAAGSALSPAALARQALSLPEMLSPNPPDTCGDRSFTRTELALERNRQFAAASCEVQEILERRSLRRVLYVHSAPWYWVRFGTERLSRFYTMFSLYSPALQEELVESLHSGGLDAVLHTRGFGALDRLSGAHDGLHAPLLVAYLMERLRDTETVATPLGSLQLANPVPEPPTREAAPGLGPLALHVDWMVYDEQSGFLWGKGWAMDRQRGRPLETIEVGCPEPCGAVELGLPRPDVAAAGTAPAPAATGWELTAFLPSHARPTLRLVPEEGPAREQAIDLLEARHLAGRHGAEWEGLRDRVQKMVELGRADRFSHAERSPALSLESRAR